MESLHFLFYLMFIVSDIIKKIHVLYTFSSTEFLSWFAMYHQEMSLSMCFMTSIILSNLKNIDVLILWHQNWLTIEHLHNRILHRMRMNYLKIICIIDDSLKHTVDSMNRDSKEYIVYDFLSWSGCKVHGHVHLWISSLCVCVCIYIYTHTYTSIWAISYTPLGFSISQEVFPDFRTCYETDAHIHVPY